MPCVPFLMNTTDSGTCSAPEGSKREMHSKYAHLVSQTKGDTHYEGAFPIYLTPQKRY
jgi:hypothetical protein